MSTSPIKSQDSSGGALDQQFRTLSTRYASLLNGAGSRCVPYWDESLPSFSKASRQSKLHAIEFLEMANGVLQDAIEDGKSLHDNRYILWRTLTKLRLVPDSVVFDHMREGDILEVFSIDPPGHIAWNLRMMESTSYTVEQLLCLDWSELGDRPAEAMKVCGERIMQIASGAMTKTEPAKIPPHQLQEANSSELFTVNLNIKYLSPLKRDGRNVAFISIGEAEIVGSRRALKSTP